MSVAARILQAITDELSERAPVLEGCAGGTVSVIVQLDAAGVPKQVVMRAEMRRQVERSRPRALAV